MPHRLLELTYEEWCQWASTLPKGSVWWVEDLVIDYWESLMNPIAGPYNAEQLLTPVYTISWRGQVEFRRQSELIYLRARRLHDNI